MSNHLNECNSDTPNRTYHDKTKKTPCTVPYLLCYRMKKPVKGINIAVGTGKARSIQAASENSSTM
jgi:hypothetical protein